MAELNVEDVVQAYIKLRDMKQEKQRGHKDELAPINEKMNQLEAWLQRKLQKDGVDSMKTPAGTAYTQTNTKATVADRDAFLDYVRENDAWDLLENRVSKSAVEDYIASTGDVVPGVQLSRDQVVRIRR